MAPGWGGCDSLGRGNIRTQRLPAARERRRTDQPSRPHQVRGRQIGAPRSPTIAKLSQVVDDAGTDVPTTGTVVTGLRATTPRPRAGYRSLGFFL